MNPALFDITLENCTAIQQMSQVDRVNYFASQPSILIPVIVGFLLLAFVMFIFGLIVGLGKSHKPLLTNPNFFIFFVFWLIIGGLTLYMMISGIWIKPFI